MTSTLIPRLSISTHEFRAATGRAFAVATTSRALAAAILVCAVLAPSALAQKDKEKDTVHLRGDKVESGVIDDEEYAGLTLEGKGGAKKLFPWSEIVGIEYAGAAELSAAQSALSSGKFADAAAGFDAVLKTDKLRAPLKQEALFYLAVSNGKNGDEVGALAAYREFVETFPKGRYVRPAADHVVAALAGDGDFAGANTFLDKLADGSKTTAGFEAEVALLRGRVFEAQGKDKAADALAQYDGAAKVVGITAAAQAEISLGRGRALQLQGKRVDAETIFRALTTAENSGPVLAGAWNGIGEMLAEEGKSKRDSEKILDALYCHLRGVVQYRPLDGEATVEYERALAGSSTCFKFISELAQNPEQKRLYSERSREKMDQLRREFPSSPYLKN